VSHVLRTLFANAAHQLPVAMRMRPGVLTRFNSVDALGKFSEI